MNWRFKTGTEKYPALTGMRALCATSVFFLHFPLIGGLDMSLNLLAFFFVLSGFLIIRIYYDQAQLIGSWLSKYFINRFARIYPVYFLLLTIAVLLRHDFRPLMLIKNYTLIHALFHNSGDIVIEQSWSLTVEECFYFFAPFLILLIRRWNFFVAGLIAVLTLGIALLISTAGISFLGTPLFVFSTTFFGHFFEFFAGIYLALVIMKRENKKTTMAKENKGAIIAKENKRFTKPKGYKWTTLGILGVIALTIPMKMIYAHTPVHHWGIILVNNFLLPLPIALFYFGLITENNFLSCILSGRLFGLLGRSSYSLYLLHIMIINYISLPLLYTLFGGSHFLMVILTFIGSYLLSIAIFLFYEEPLNLFIRKKFRSKDRSVGMTATLFQQL